MEQTQINIFLYKGEHGRTLRLDIWNEEDFRHFQQVLLRLKASEKEMFNCREDARFSLYNLENFCIAKYRGDKYIGVNSRRNESGGMTVTWFLNDARLNETISQLLTLKSAPGSRRLNAAGEYALIEIAYQEDLG